MLRLREDDDIVITMESSLFYAQVQFVVSQTCH